MNKSKLAWPGLSALRVPLIMPAGHWHFVVCCCSLSLSLSLSLSRMGSVHNPVTLASTHTHQEKEREKGGELLCLPQSWRHAYCMWPNAGRLKPSCKYATSCHAFFNSNTRDRQRQREREGQTLIPNNKYQQVARGQSRGGCPSWPLA